ncbi:MAG: SMI1/KNR4 family protein [Loktanella sp.]|nr:SMI1/KNR4 family protein [Loktanella sp.]
MHLVFEKFRDLCENGIVAGPASDTQIKDAETALRVVFPDQYRTFLRGYGALVAQGIEIYGIIYPVKNDPPMWQQVVETTLQLRSWKQAGSENSGMIPISQDGAGNYFYLEAASETQARVWAIGPGIELVVASSLHEFATEYASGRLVI